MDMRAVDHQVKVQEWRKIITECRSSGMSISKWCSDNGIKPNQYYYWLRVIRNESLALMPPESKIANPSFAAVKIAETVNRDSTDIDTCAVIKTDNFSIEIKSSADSDILEQIFRILSSLC